MMSQPTLISMPDNAATGIGSAIHPRPSTRASSTAAQVTPETGVVPPARTFTVVPDGAPAPGRAPSTPAATLAMPWPTSSRLGRVRVRVSVSATSEATRLLTEPISASVNAGCMADNSRSGSSSGRYSSGNPCGSLPMVGASCNHSAAIAVPTNRANSGPGKNRPSRRGQNTQIARHTAPTITACRFSPKTAAGQTRMMPSSPPGAAGAPRNGSV